MSWYVVIDDEGSSPIFGIIEASSLAVAKRKLHEFLLDEEKEIRRTDGPEEARNWAKTWLATLRIEKTEIIR